MLIVLLWAGWCNETFSIANYMYLTFSNGNTTSAFLFPLLGELYFGRLIGGFKGSVFSFKVKNFSILILFLLLEMTMKQT